MTSLSSRGYTVLPEPQRVALEPADIEFDATWRLGVAGDLSTDDGLCAILNDYLGERHGVTLLGTPSAGPRVVLSLAPQRDMVTVVGAADRDLPSLTAQEYEIRIGPNGVFINATARAGSRVLGGQAWQVPVGGADHCDHVPLRRQRQHDTWSLTACLGVSRRGGFRGSR